MLPNIISPCGLRTALMGSVAGTLALAIGSGQALAATATEIVITGSRIPQKNLITTSPVVTVGSADVNAQGITRVEDLTNSLPQVFAGQNATVANGSNGTATVDLRGLGARRTLVLLDGKRMPYGSPTASPAADLNQIPGQLVDRIEVLTGGASAVYGSDALAGVVNFIMKKDFEGLKLDAQYAVYQHNQQDGLDGQLDTVIRNRGLTNPSQFRLPSRSVTDGDSREITVIAGAASGDNRTHVEGYFTWRKNNPILEANRNFSACSIGGQNAAGKNGGNQVVAGFPANTEFTCGGSSTSFPGRFLGTASFGGSSTIDAATTGALTAFRAFNANLDQYNFGPLNFYQRPDERYAFGAFGTYDLWQGAELYANMMFTDYQTVAQIAPSGRLFNTTTINCGGNTAAGTGRSGGCTAAQITADADLYRAAQCRGGGRQTTASCGATGHSSAYAATGMDGAGLRRLRSTLPRRHFSRSIAMTSRLRGSDEHDVVDADAGAGVVPSAARW
ncbi:MAG: TonB-dependent receptor plug domain-containing protein [Alphaproteobacteria bacterium]